jgi:5'-3' exoribonuclease 1
MGVPRLFRLLVERYPLILRSTEDHPMPEFDNFYLDFNGIVHTCTHGNRADDRIKSQTVRFLPLFVAAYNCVCSLLLQEMMMDLFSVIESLFDTIRPRKLLYIAIDGVVSVSAGLYHLCHRGYASIS